MLGKTVLQAARERIAWLYDEFEVVVACISGGKDSTVVWHLCLEEAQRRGRKLPTMFIDQEAEFTEAIDTVRESMNHPDVVPYWLQIPMHLDNATSYSERVLKCWDPEREADWIRPKEPNSITVNRYGTNRFAELFTAVLRVEFPDKRVASIGGVRTEESPGRYAGLTSYATYKWATWGKALDKKREHYTFYPIYDWTVSDVWKCIHEHGWPYCKVYDVFYQYGVEVRRMRVSNLHHETAVPTLFYLQETDPDLYVRMTKRLSGIDMAGKFGEDYYTKHLPPMFADWDEYASHLIDKLVTDPKWKADLEATRTLLRAHYKDSKKDRDKAARVVVSSVLANDYTGTKLKNLLVSEVSMEKQDRRAEELQAAPWHKAKTADWPHEYIRKHECPDLYVWLHRMIRQAGMNEQWINKGKATGRFYRYFYFAGYKYWYMSEDLEQSIIINRVPVEVQA